LDYLWLCYPLSYNAIGNLTNDGYGTLTYGSSAHKHAVTAWNGNSYGYDANGNQTTRTIGGSTSTLAYDAENRLTPFNIGPHQRRACHTWHETCAIMNITLTVRSKCAIIKQICLPGRLRLVPPI